MAAAAGIRIAEVRVQDFKVIRDACVSLAPGTTVFVGENNTGKSSLLQALEAALARRQSTEDDLHCAADGSRADHFEVDLLIVPLAGSSFDAEVTGAYGPGAVQPPGADGREFVAVRTVARASSDGSLLRFERNYLQGWARTRTEAATLPVLNSPRVAAPGSDLIQFFMLDAARDLVTELRNPTSAWGRSVADLGLTPADRATLNGQLAQLGAEIAARSPILETLRQSLDRIKELIASGVASTAIAPIPRAVSELPRSMDVLVQAPGSAAIPLRLQGMGGRSLASLMIFQAFVEVRLSKLTVPPLAVSAFEEPEAHLHPHAQRAVTRQIDSIGGQKLVSTHSPYVAAAAELDTLRVLTRQADSVTVRQLRAPLSANERTLIRRQVQRRGGEALFARLAVLVEGVPEETALSAFGEAHWAGRLASLGISLLSVDGAQGFVPFVTVLEELGIRWVILIDGDTAGDDGLAKVATRLGRAIDRNTADVFQLPAGQDFEQYLATCGVGLEIESGIASRFGPTALADYQTTRHGTAYPKNQGNRDYTSAGGKERLIRDFLRSNKGHYGQAVAEAICAVQGADGKPKMPAIVMQLLQHVDALVA
jgi:putative ATP-dependent endonuclease of the OLD family